MAHIVGLGLGANPTRQHLGDDSRLPWRKRTLTFTLTYCMHCTSLLSKRRVACGVCVGHLVRKYGVGSSIIDVNGHDRALFWASSGLTRSFIGAHPSPVLFLLTSPTLSYLTPSSGPLSIPCLPHSLLHAVSKPSQYQRPPPVKVERPKTRHAGRPPKRAGQFSTLTLASHDSQDRLSLPVLTLRYAPISHKWNEHLVLGYLTVHFLDGQDTLNPPSQPLQQGDSYFRAWRGRVVIKSDKERGRMLLGA